MVPRGNAGSGITAVALYDYEAADEDELSFDPDDVIYDIEKVKCCNSAEWFMNIGLVFFVYVWIVWIVLPDVAKSWMKSLVWRQSHEKPT